MEAISDASDACHHPNCFVFVRIYGILNPDFIEWATKLYAANHGGEPYILYRYYLDYIFPPVGPTLHSRGSVFELPCNRGLAPSDRILWEATFKFAFPQIMHSKGQSIRSISEGPGRPGVIEARPGDIRANLSSMLSSDALYESSEPVDPDTQRQIHGKFVL